VSENSAIARFQSARRDGALAVLEGFHPVKHALRFGGRFLELATSDPERLDDLCAALAPDVAPLLNAVPRQLLSEEALRSISSAPRGEPVVALALRPAVDVTALLREESTRPVILLEDPANLNNIGAVVRVAAAAGAAGVVTTGMHDPWNAAALRGSAGLHYALPVGRADGLPESRRTLVALHPDGDPLPFDDWPDHAILAFGSERRGLSAGLLRRADRRIALPMRSGVSSLSLATAVAATLYARAAALGRPPG
jgi:RNA methyltransferase, TrmH family